jgi:hypothetical protein
MVTPKQTARTLLRANRKNGISWRQIEKHGYVEDGIIIKPGINNTTICRFAKSKGAWMPKDIEILKLLGLHHEKQPRPKMISEMSANELLYCLDNRQPFKPTMTQTQLRDYVRACKEARMQTS